MQSGILDEMKKKIVLLSGLAKAVLLVYHSAADVEGTEWGTAV